MEARDPQLSQAYREAAHPEPSPALDASILDAARRAVASPPRRHRPAWLAWALPLSSSAVLLLGLGLLFEMQRQAPEALAPPPAATPADPAERMEAMAEARGTTPAAKVDSVDRAETAAGSAPRPDDLPAAPDAPKPFPAGPGAPLEAAPMASRDGAAALAEQPRQAAPAPGASPPLPAPALENAPAPDQSLAKRQAAPLPVEQWVERIRRLLREGRQEDARHALAELRRTHPDFVPPEDLKDL